MILRSACRGAYLVAPIMSRFHGRSGDTSVTHDSGEIMNHLGLH